MSPDSVPLIYVLIMTGLVTVSVAMQIYEDDGCLANCVVSTNYNPVCGTDYITYTNPTMLICWKKCKDPSLGVAHFSTCVDWITGNYKL